MPKRPLSPLMLFLFPALALLSACDSADPVALNEKIDKGQAADAISTITESLESQPGNPTYNALLFKARLMACVANNCITSTAQLKELTQLAEKTPLTAVPLDETHTLKPADAVHTAATRIALPATKTTSATTTLPLVTFYEAMPPAYRPAVVDAAFAAPLMLLRQENSTAALENLQALTRANQLPDIARHWALLQTGLMSGEEAVEESALIALRNTAKGITVPSSAMRLLPYTLPVTDIPHLAQTYTSTTESWKLPLITPEAQSKVAGEINLIRTSPELLKSWLKTPPATIGRLTSATTDLNSEDILAQLWLIRLSLALNPNQPELWTDFLSLTTRIANQKGSNSELLLAMLTGEGAPGKPSSTMQETYVTTLFKLIEAQAAKGQPLLPLLRQFSLITLDKQTAVRFEKMLQAGLESAVAQKRIADVEAYASFKPEVARGSRQSVVPILVEGLKDDLRGGNFEHATELSKLITETMGVDFNYDALLLQEFDQEMRDADMAEKLSSNTPEVLLQPAETATLELGPFWTFLQEHFSTEPEVLDQQLKNLVANAHGLYGTPTAMYRLFPSFSESNFPTEIRQAYLVNAIQRSLLDDQRLTGAELADLAWRLSQRHQGLSLSTLIENALTRAETLEDSRTLWEQSPAPVRQTITTVRPQFAALMRGIDAWNNKRQTQAATAFAEMNSTAAAQYADQLAPYMDVLRDKLITVSGIYATNSPDSSLPTGIIQVNAPALVNSGTVSMLDVTFFGKIGAQPTQNPDTLITSYGNIRQTTVPAPLDFDNLNINLSNSLKQTYSTPSPFEESYGDINQLTFSNNGKTLTVKARGLKQPLTFSKLLIDPKGTLFPEGTYTVSQQLSPANPATDVILPPGSMLTVTTSRVPTTALRGQDVLGTIYPITGVLAHPGMAKPQEIEGYYESGKHTVNLTFTPPLLKGNVARAAVRCQLLGTSMLCGAHHTHSNRITFNHRVVAVQTKESTKAQTTLWEKANLVTRKAWEALNADQLFGKSASDDVAKKATAVSETTVSNTRFETVVSETTTISSSLPKEEEDAKANIAEPAVDEEDEAETDEPAIPNVPSLEGTSRTDQPTRSRP